MLLRCLFKHVRNLPGDACGAGTPNDAGRLRFLPLRTKIWRALPFSLLRAGKIIAKAKVIQNARSKMGTMAENHAHPTGPPAMDHAEDEKRASCFSSS
jgi:hypothetical protein